MSPPVKLLSRWSHAGEMDAVAAKSMATINHPFHPVPRLFFRFHRVQVEDSMALVDIVGNGKPDGGEDKGVVTRTTRISIVITRTQGRSMNGVRQIPDHPYTNAFYEGREPWP